MVTITDWNDLDAVRNDLTADYTLENDLDKNTNGYNSVASPTANNDQGFDPIGNDKFGEEVFTGSFDGQGNAIYDLTIDRSGRRLIALFAKASDIQNLNVLDASINVDSGFDVDTHAILAAADPGTSEEEMNLVNCTVSGSITVVGGADRVGGLAGQLYDVGTIQNCVSHADVSSDGIHIGGLVGYNKDTITDSYATGAVDGDGNTGGLVGTNDSGAVTDSYATGAVDGYGGNVGGLVGRNDSAVTDSYATGSVTSSSLRVGGLVGINYATIQTSYAVGSVTGDTDVGGLVGGNESGTELSDSYADEETTGQTSLTGTTGGPNTNSRLLTTSEMQGDEASNSGNMDGFDYTSNWKTVLSEDSDASDDGYPILQSADRIDQLKTQGIYVPPPPSAPSNLSVSIN